MPAMPTAQTAAASTISGVAPAVARPRAPIVAIAAANGMSSREAGMWSWIAPHTGAVPTTTAEVKAASSPIAGSGMPRLW